MSKKKKVLIIAIVIFALCLLSFLIYFLLQKFNITSVSALRKFISKFGGGAWLVFLLTQIVISVPVFVIPFEDELWVGLAIILFGVKIGFLLSVVAMITTSSILYAFGRTFGLKFANKLIGKEEVASVQEKSDMNNRLSLPFLYLVPMFPHDVLCVTSGIAKMNFLYFFVVTLLMRSLEIIAICFMGGNLIDWSSLTVFEWCVLLNLGIVDVYLLQKLKNYMEKKIGKTKDISNE